MKYLEIAIAVLKAEAEAISLTAKRLDENFLRAVDIILSHPGKTVVCAIGKSGHIGVKMAATLASTGTRAVFLHASEAVHGDFGIYEPGDPTILISKSGATEEILRLIPTLKQFSSPIIAIVGNLISPLARKADVTLDASIKLEADPLGIVPTTSTTVAMALGDALASALMEARKFTENDFAQFHPAGQIGRNLLMSVSDLMHPIDKVACVEPETTLKNLVIEMSFQPLGAACVVDKEKRLVGLITDGDIRRAFQNHDDIRLLTSSDIMTKHPQCTQPASTLNEVVRTMEDRSSQISVLPVTNPKNNNLLGLIRLHDIFQAEIT